MSSFSDQIFTVTRVIVTLGLSYESMIPTSLPNQVVRVGPLFYCQGKSVPDIVCKSASKRFISIC